MTVDLTAGEAVFRAVGSKIKFHGFMKVYVEGNDDAADSGDDDDRLLPPLKQGDQVTKKQIDPKQHFTQPPPRFTEARLVKALEEMGIGRPSTYAPTLETIQKRGYVAIEDKKFVPTELGELVIQQMIEFFPEILDVEFTAHMEEGLDHIEEGKEDWVQVLSEFYESFEKRLEVAEEEMEKVEIQDEVSTKFARSAAAILYTRWVDSASFLPAQAFRTAAIRSRSSKISACRVRLVIKEKSSNAAAKRDAYFMVATAIPSANSSRGISRSASLVRSAAGC